MLRSRFRPRLNANLLFEQESDPREFAGAASTLGPWEWPDSDWEVAGVWAISLQSST